VEVASSGATAARVMTESTMLATMCVQCSIWLTRVPRQAVWKKVFLLVTNHMLSKVDLSELLDSLNARGGPVKL
jgi:hypothetical protein